MLGFVSYPDWLGKIYNFTPFKNGLRFLVFLITLFSFGYVGTLLFKHKFRNVQPAGSDQLSSQILYVTFWFLIVYIGMHSFFYVLTRYALPISSLHLILVAVTIQQLGQAKTNRN